MKINTLLLPSGKTINYQEDVDLSYYRGDQYHVRSIKSCHMNLSITNYDNLICLSFDISGTIFTTCAYTLEEIPYDYHIKDNIELNYQEDDDFVITDNQIDIDEMLITLIVSNIPFKIIKKGAKLPASGDGYIVISEEEMEKRKKSSPFDALDNLEID